MGEQSTARSQTLWQENLNNPRSNDFSRYSWEKATKVATTTHCY
jgi:hypothetical protein